MTAERRCQLCGDPHGKTRTGRLGRYRLTCKGCEARKGSHLVETREGYAAAEPASSRRAA